MKVLIGIATYKRPEKLKRCIDSILNSTHQDFHIVVVCDNNDWDTHEFLLKKYDINLPLYSFIQPEHKYVIGAWNKVVNLNIPYPYWQSFIGLCDDVELEPNALEKAIQTHQKRFPDTDGVVGFKQVCPGHNNYNFKWFGQTLMGRKFIERYKDVNYQICAPMYSHFFQDEEMYDFANSLNKFEVCPQAILKHYHPGFVKSEIDETHNITRDGHNSPKKRDTEIFNRRRLEGKIWGKTWEI